MPTPQKNKQTLASLTSAAPSKSPKRPTSAKSPKKPAAKTAAPKPAAKAAALKTSPAIGDSAPEEVFYYERRQIILLTAVYAALACLVWLLANCMLAAGLVTSWAQVILQIAVMALSLAALGAAVFVLIFPQKLAVITQSSIKIDHNAALKWSDVALAEEKDASPLTRRPIIVLHLKPGKLENYRLTFMQKLCRHNVFTPFSIPLYAMDAEDAAKIRALVKKRAPKYQPAR